MPAHADSPKVIRVGFPQQVGLSETDENGRHSGYTYEYLMEIAQYTGWKYEFITLSDMELNDAIGEMMTMLENGELDLMGSLRKNAALEELYTYPGYHYGTSSATLCALDGNGEIEAHNYYYKQNLRIVLPKSATRQMGLLDSFCKANSITPELVFSNNEAEQMDMLREGKADLVMGRDISPIEGTKVVAKFAPEPFFFASTKGNTEIVAQLDAALLYIEEANPSFASTAYSKYFVHAASTVLELTEEELSYIASLEPLIVGLPPDRDPLLSYNWSTHKADGIVVDILERIAQTTGLDFVYTSAKTVDEFNSVSLGGAFDIIAGMGYDYEAAKNYNVIMTQPVLSVPYVRVERTVDAVSSSIYGLPERLKYMPCNEAHSTTSNLVFSPTHELLKAVVKGEIEAAYMESYIAQQLLNDHNYQSLSLVQSPGGASELCLGISRDRQDVRLVSILSKALRAIPEHDLSAMVYNNTFYTNAMTLGRFISLYPMQCIGFIALLLLLVILFLSFYLRRVTQLKDALSIKAQCDTLTGLYNLDSFRQLVCARFTHSGGAGGVFMIMDLDNFKGINDSFGHFEGDNVLMAVADALRESLGEVYCIGRLGGDEFVAYADGPDEADMVEQRYAQISRRCASISQELTVTISAGIVHFTRAPDFDEMYKQADSNLYTVKQRGRNGCEISEMVP